MKQKHLVLVDERPPIESLNRIASNLRSDGIVLIYEVINPKKYQKRIGNDVTFDKDKFIDDLKNIPFIHRLDVFATDYNLIEGQLKGIDVIRFFTKIKPKYKKHIIIYSAQIDGVIGDIINGDITNGSANKFEYQSAMLKLMTHLNIEYLNSAGQFENEFKKFLKNESDITIDDRLIEAIEAINSDKIHCSIPPYTNKSIAEIGELLESKNSQAIDLRKEITDHIMAIITDVEGYE